MARVRFSGRSSRAASRAKSRRRRCRNPGKVSWINQESRKTGNRIETKSSCSSPEIFSGVPIFLIHPSGVKRKFDPAEPELMDRPQPVSAELERDLRNLRQLNRYFGSYAIVLRFMRRWINPGDRIRIADL